MTRAPTNSYNTGSGRRWCIRCLTLAALAGPCGSIAYAQPAMSVGVDAVRVENVTRMHVVTGEIVARRRSTIAGEEQGLVHWANFDAGDRVKAGDILAELDDDLLQLELAELEAELAQQQARAEELAVRVQRTQRDLTDLQNLQQRDAAKTKEIEDARSELAGALAAQKSAQASVDLAEARINTMKRRIESRHIKAPFSGVVVVKRIEAGQWVGDGGAIAELIELDLVDAQLKVPEYLVNQLTIGTRIEVTVAGGSEPISGKVRAIVPEGDLRARTYPVKVLIDNTQGHLLPGMSVRAWLPTAEYDNALTISRDAVLTSPTGPYVYAVREDSVYPVAVEIVSSAGVTRYAVLGQLSPGTLVVVEGNEQLYPGAKVKVARQADPES